MGNWLAQNYLTVIICAALIAAAALAVRGIVKNKKKGGSACGCGCANCPMSGSCHNKKL